MLRARLLPCLRSPLLGLAALALTACHDGDGGGPSPDNNVIDDAGLADLVVSAGAFEVAFQPATLDYQVRAPSGVDATTVTATTSDPEATLVIEGLPAASGVPFGPLPVPFGDTRVEVVVTAEDGVTTRTYTVEVTRIPFFVTRISVPQGAVWKVNAPIVFSFNEAIDFSTVSANTIPIVSTAGVPALGTFELRDEVTLVFQPNCPVLDDLSDVGLPPGFIEHTLTVRGRDSFTNTVRARSGGPLEQTVTRSFITDGFDSAFVDTEFGPPRALVRAQGSGEANASYVELGGDADRRVYFELDAGQELGFSEPGFQAPLNLFSEPGTNVALVLAFDQSVFPATNVSEHLRLEFLDASGTWRPLGTRVTLLTNCANDARARLEPSGILPQNARIRAVVLPGFMDLVGETSLEPFEELVVPTRPVAFTSLAPADELSDELFESFDLGGPGSLEDTQVVFDGPRAIWGAGRLSAAFEFDSVGGPNGDFDWVVRHGDNFFLDTTNGSIIGGPNGAPTAEQPVDDGFVEVRNLTIEQGATVRVQGPKPLRIHATGDVRIRGTLDLSGFNARDVATLNTGNQVEFGGAGAAGGGRGGPANEVTTGSTPRGGRGGGPFGEVNTGGQGGETGFAPPSLGKDARRPGGGGGGRFAADVPGTPTAPLSLVATAGTNGSPFSTGAVSGASPARGGEPGLGPFRDVDAGNDFLGTRAVRSGGQLVGLVRGELARLMGGYGGGGGGNADPANTFPTPNWNFSSDEKGGGGGGAAGGLEIKALGRIVFGPEGAIVANGGRGGTGENTNFLDHVGGTGGGASGGHVILESAQEIDFTDEGANVNGPSRDWLQALGPALRRGPVGDVVPDARGFSNGGAGGAGVVQLHVPDPALNLVFPLAAGASADPLDAVSSPPALALVPSLGARSRARSKWIPLGEAALDGAGTPGTMRFLFQGLEQTSGPDQGKIATSGSTVIEQAPLVAGDLAELQLLPGGLAFELRGAALAALRAGNTAGLSNALYLRTPALLEGFVLRLEAPAETRDFQVADASYDEGSEAPDDEALSLTTALEVQGSPLDFVTAHAHEALTYALVPRSFRVVTGDAEDFLPPTSFARIRFQAARDDGSGAADEENPLVDWTSDLSAFGEVAPGALRFVRFEVEFDLDTQGQGLSPEIEPVTLDFLRIPFVF